MTSLASYSSVLSVRFIVERTPPAEPGNRRGCPTIAHLVKGKELDRGAHSRCIDEFFGVMIDLPSATSTARADVKLASLNCGGRWWRQIDFVFYRLSMIGELQVGAINTVKLPDHSQEICLSP